MWRNDDGSSVFNRPAHEQAHLKRRDHWWKPLGYLLLTLHWFNPLVWVAYLLLCRDIELACDEKVIQKMDLERKKAYSNALVACSVSRRSIAICPLAFGEVSVKSRVRSILNYKKPAFWIILVSLVLCILAAVFILTDPVTPSLAELAEVNPAICDVMVIRTDEGTIEITSPFEIQDTAALLKEIRISHSPLSEDRSEERPQENSISFRFGKTYIAYHFNMECTEVWIDDDVKPSLSFEVKSNDLIRNFFKYALDAREAASEANDSATVASKPSPEVSSAVSEAAPAISELFDTLCAKYNYSDLNSASAIAEANSPEWNAIIAGGDASIRYIISEFMADDQTGERGEFMALALRNLSPDEALRTKGKNGQDYFYIWREYIERIYELNGEEFVQEHHHAGWILLSEFILDAQ